MVSALWKACSEGNLEDVLELLKEATSIDIEIKDHTGVTPLIEAIKNGHIEVVRALLDRGVDPTNACSQGPPEQFTTDPAILELLDAVKIKMSSNSPPIQEPAYAHDPSMDPTKSYYGPPAGAYYYPGMPVGAPMLPEGAVPYYPAPPPVATEQVPGGLANLPPPEVARMIPCRYYPACRYGSSCIFAHPQAPYLQGPLPPPAQYPAPYDPMAPAPYPPPTYYAMSQPSYQTSPTGIPMTAMSPSSGSHPPLPHPSMTHGRSSSEVVSPVQAPFSPSGAPPPMPYGVSPMSPTYGHPGQAPVPVSIPSLPPLQHSVVGGPQTPQQNVYTSMSPNASGAMAYAVQRDLAGHFPPQVHPQVDSYAPGSVNREVMTRHRRGSARRPSFGGPGRKPPCLFFPSGRCRNGDECRFPHVLPDASAPHHPSHFSARGGHRPRPSVHANGITTIEEKLSVMTVQDDRQTSHSRHGTNGTNGTEDSSRSQSTEPGSRRGFSQSYRSNHLPNVSRPEKKFSPPKPQRVPNADEFPVLTSTTPPLRSPGTHGPASTGYSGPTAAQVLQAPPPARKDSQSILRGTTPEQNSSSQGSQDGKLETSAVAPPQESVVSELPVSFAAAATAAPDAAKEVSVSA
ncbi:hypothetical protein AcV5_004781 [Taiwanofungus camphoratus]|nr:hypothetical protein AcV5_004781 [Antrodia cinnamomea]